MYPKPPFASQSQPWPGLASRMNPPPDHGEQSYRGRGRLSGRKALVTGGDSGIGRAAAIAFAREGADVAISYLPAEEEDAQAVAHWIRDAGRKAVLLPGDISHEGVCERLVADAVTQLGGLDILVNNAGRMGQTQGLLETSTERFDTLMKTNV
ncbi:MAG TPA: SDR family NAD(P)-dependent oxidoreductase, partial [Dokdonella sp.]